MKYQKELKASAIKNGWTQDKISKTLKVSRTTASNKFKSKEIEKSIDFLILLGLRIIDGEGKNIVTGEQEIIQVGPMTMTNNQLKDLKEKLGLKISE